MRTRTREYLGIFLGILGLLFLLVSNNLLWFGWDVLWPIFPVLVGTFWLRMFITRRKARQLFLGIFLLMFGVFFFLFSSGILPWTAMATAWPVILILVGLALLAVTGVAEQAASALLVGITFVLFGISSILITTEVIAPRVSQPLIRLWPLVLVGAGLLLYLLSRREREEEDLKKLAAAHEAAVMATRRRQAGDSSTPHT